MGPFVPPRQKADWEYDAGPMTVSAQVMAIAERLMRRGYNYSLTDRMHGATWISTVEHVDAYLQCCGHDRSNWVGCGWRSSGPPGGAGGPEHNPHLRQWNIHRAEMAIREGLLDVNGEEVPF